MAADFNLLLRDQVLNIETARLRLADGRAEFAGRVELHGSYAARVKGTFDSLDLARLVKGFDTRLNGSVELDARFRPTIAGRAEVALADSRLMGRALDGRATVALADQRIDVDVNVASRSARLTARGGLGSGRELTFELVAPQLAEIVPQTSGSCDRARHGERRIFGAAVARGCHRERPEVRQRPDDRQRDLRRLPAALPRPPRLPSW